MHSKIFSSALLALLSASVAKAQTHSECNPVEGDTCNPDPAFAGSVEIDFTQGEHDFFESLAGTTITYDEENGAVYSISNDRQAPTVASPEYIFFGELEVELKAAPGAGIVTSIVLQSDCLDEIDWEWVGGSPDQVQSNYFSKGSTETYDRGGTHPVPASTSNFYTYKIVWTQESLTWMINGEVIRTLGYAEANGGLEYPQTPMQVKLGTWVAGREGAPEGTIQWAGGVANFEDGPSEAYYKRVSITDYAGGVEGAQSYVYTSETGTWESILVDTEGGSLSAQQETSDDEDSEDTNDGDESEGGSNSTTTVAAPTTSQTAGLSESLSSAGSAGSDDDSEIPGSGAATSRFAIAGLVLSGLAVFANL